MKKLIVATKLISWRDKETFMRELSEAIYDYQNDGQEVEIQYAPIDNCFSALIIVRE